MQIVFFDSGVGGLTVLEEAKILLPNERFVYYADSDNIPYGTKSKNEINDLVFKAISFFDPKTIKALVLACNTATSVAVNDLRREFSFPIIGMEPAVKPATQLGDKRILVCATDRTLKLDKLKDLIDDLDVLDRVDMMSLQELVLYAENFNFNDPGLMKYLIEKFKNFNCCIKVSFHSSNLVVHFSNTIYRNHGRKVNLIFITNRFNVLNSI